MTPSRQVAKTVEASAPNHRPDAEPPPLWRLDSSLESAPAEGSPVWIGFAPLGGRRTVPPALFYRREFVVSEIPRRALLHITALGIFGCEINGRRVGEDVFAPGWTDYRHRVHYCSYDVADVRGRTSIPKDAARGRKKRRRASGSHRRR